MKLIELYENPTFKNAMEQLTPEQRKQTEEDLQKILDMFHQNIVKPLEQAGYIENS